MCPPWRAPSGSLLHTRWRSATAVSIHRSRTASGTPLSSPDLPWGAWCPRRSAVVEPACRRPIGPALLRVPSLRSRGPTNRGPCCRHIRIRKNRIGCSRWRRHDAHLSTGRIRIPAGSPFEQVWKYYQEATKKTREKRLRTSPTIEIGSIFTDGRRGGGRLRTWCHRRFEQLGPAFPAMPNAHLIVRLRLPGRDRRIRRAARLLVPGPHARVAKRAR
jgi:hypothetical protein